MGYEIKKDKYLNNDVLQIYDDKIDVKVGTKKYPLLCIGRKKAQIIVDNIEEIKKFLEGK